MIAATPESLGGEASVSVSKPARHRLLNVGLDDSSLSSVLDEFADWLAADAGPMQPAFVNADCLNRAWTDSSYRNLLDRLPLVLADGSGIRWALRVLHGVRLQDNVNGTDLFPLLCARAVSEGWRLGFLGADSDVVDQLVDKTSQRYPGIRIVYAHDGYFTDVEQSEVVAAIADAKPDILLVGLGAPRQEKWIDANLSQLNAGIAVGVGGLFDFYAEKVTRAPKLIRRLGLEWTWRMAQEPGRLWRRYLLGNPLFLWRAFRNRTSDGPIAT